jgi:hypothetical protein
MDGGWGNRLDWREQCFFPEFFSIKALQHDTTHLHYRRRFFFLWEWGWMFLFVEVEGEKEKRRVTYIVDGQTSEKYYQKHLIIKIVQNHSLVHHRIDSHLSFPTSSCWYSHYSIIVAM